jgi:hypothetical protein
MIHIDDILGILIGNALVHLLAHYANQDIFAHVLPLTVRDKQFASQVLHGVIA